MLRHTFVHYIAPQKCKALVAQGGVSLKQPVGYLYLRCSPKHKFLLIDLNTAESVERAPTRTSQSTMTSFGGTAQHLNFFFFFFVLSAQWAVRVSNVHDLPLGFSSTSSHGWSTQTTRSKAIRSALVTDSYTQTNWANRLASVLKSRDQRPT